MAKGGLSLGSRERHRQRLGICSAIAAKGKPTSPLGKAVVGLFHKRKLCARELASTCAAAGDNAPLDVRTLASATPMKASQARHAHEKVVRVLRHGAILPPTYVVKVPLWDKYGGKQYIGDLAIGLLTKQCLVSRRRKPISK